MVGYLCNCHHKSLIEISGFSVFSYFMHFVYIPYSAKKKCTEELPDKSPALKRENQIRSRKSPQIVRHLWLSCHKCLII